MLIGAGAIAGAGLGAAALTGCGDGEDDALEPGEVLTPLADVPVGGSVTVSTSTGLPVVVGRPQEDRVVAVSAVCTHQGCEVAPYQDDPAVLVCPCHRSEFETFTGAVLEGPAVRALPEIPVEVVGADVVTA